MKLSSFVSTPLGRLSLGLTKNNKKVKIKANPKVGLLRNTYFLTISKGNDEHTWIIIVQWTQVHCRLDPLWSPW